MAAQITRYNSMYRCDAVNDSSERVLPLVDATVILVVSICVALLRVIQLAA